MQAHSVRVEVSCPPRNLSICSQLALLAALVYLAITNAVFAQPLIEEEEGLDFGTLAVSNNTSISRFTYPNTGRNISSEGQFVHIERGTVGEYRLTGFPAFTPLSVSLNNASLYPDSIAVTEPLTVDNFDINDVLTNSQGQASLLLGARLSTTGNGAEYADSTYSGATMIRVEYWEPDAQAFVFNTKAIDLTTELRSTVQIDQEQQLHFGTLFARSSTTAQAALTMLPSGRYNISEPDGSRMVAIEAPSQGILKVSGAAAYFGLSITAQPTDILLEHTEQPNAAPHFVVSGFTTSPSGIGTTDTNGELLISVGGTIKTELTGTSSVYPSGQYKGTYEVTVSY